ncbi:hypothetical protein Pst134EA_015404 [Puccinia striiformis f. sp. tritici]|uniref:hypothetical protein n=1 Tax=Puccinia striiformis f. sp. tritici TaxID=168172 RepID=UPI0020074055|nr:hypothetical protein Pst134EA_015404 [Puccinia striiformis f. sp. tritici]KAH9463320.1 hypothetical protein Pst134EA_015404 [Puccinia striiformis f. sp. tritici]
MPSLAATIVGLALIAHTSAHLSLLNIYGSNDVVGHGFGVNMYGKYPRVRGEPGDAGGDSGVFETGTDNPSPASEGDGLPAAYANMSVVIQAFQVNRDGGGPMSCEYSEDASTTSWKPMFMTLNQAGNSGIQNSLRTNETVVTNFPADAKCTGGWTQTACIVRCRTGVNKRFGGCFAVKLSDSDAPSMASTTADSNDTSIVARPVANETDAQTSTNSLTDEQITLIANQVIIQMKNDGLVFPSNSTEAAAAGDKSSDSQTTDPPVSRVADANDADSNKMATETPSNESNTPDTSSDTPTAKPPMPESSTATSSKMAEPSSPDPQVAPIAPKPVSRQGENDSLNKSPAAPDTGNTLLDVTNTAQNLLNVTASSLDTPAPDNSVVRAVDTDANLKANSTSDANPIVLGNATLSTSDRAGTQVNGSMLDTNQTSPNHPSVAQNTRLVNTNAGINATLAKHHPVTKHASNIQTDQDTHADLKRPVIVAIHASHTPLVNGSSEGSRFTPVNVTSGEGSSLASDNSTITPDQMSSLSDNSTLVDASDIADNELYKSKAVNGTSQVKKHLKRCGSSHRKPKRKVQ